MLVAPKDAGSGWRGVMRLPCGWFQYLGGGFSRWIHFRLRLWRDLSTGRLCYQAAGAGHLFTIASQAAFYAGV